MDENIVLVEEFLKLTITLVKKKQKKKLTNTNPTWKLIVNVSFS